MYNFVYIDFLKGKKYVFVQLIFERKKKTAILENMCSCFDTLFFDPMHV